METVLYFRYSQLCGWIRIVYILCPNSHSRRMSIAPAGIQESQRSAEKVHVKFGVRVKLVVKERSELARYVMYR